MILADPPKIRCRDYEMLRVQYLIAFTFDLVRHAAGGLKPADHLSEGVPYLRQAYDILDKSSQLMWLM